ncbi:MAG TPA: transcriptional regulator BetI [Dongiaceae bacterium]|nr:transcriptional regulator BetI [Dongiaceae bacterium]
MNTSRKKRSVKDMRRDELMEAAIMVIAKEGLHGTTLSQIAVEAGMSTALVNHYFDSKEDLLEATMRRLSGRYRSEIMKLMPANPTPAQRLRAIIEGSFQPDNLTLASRKAWVQFLVNAMSGGRIFHLFRLTGERVVSNIRHAVKQLVPPDQVDDAVDGIAAMIDGFFWENATDCSAEDLRRARRICWNYAVLLIPSLRDTH